MKKEVSDHIAKAFFETKAVKKNDDRLLFYIVVSLLFVACFIFVSSFFLGPKFKQIAQQGQNIIFEKHDGPYVLSFNFQDAQSKIETLNIDFPDVDLSAYKRIVFSIRMKDGGAQKLGAVKVSLVNKRRESSSQYLSDIKNSWRKLSLPLSDFGKIQDWTHLSKISFSLEQWNIVPVKGELLIDGIEFSKN